LLVDVRDLLLDLSSLFSDDVLGDSLGLNLLLDKRNSLISLLGDSRRSLLLNLGLVDLSGLLVVDVLDGLVLDHLVGLLGDSLLFDSFLVLDVLVFDFGLSSQSGRLSSQLVTELSLLLLLSWVLCSLGSSASVVTSDSLVLSSHFSVLVDFSHLGVLLAKNVSHLGEFLLHLILRFVSALLLAVVAVVHTSVWSIGLIAIVLHGVVLSIFVLSNLGIILGSHDS